MKIISWNLNGLLANVRNETFDVFYDLVPDVLCFQETKTMQEPEEENAEEEIPENPEE